MLATLLKYPAKITTDLLINISDNARQIAEFDANLEKTGATAVAVSSDFNTYSASIDFANEQFGELNAWLRLIGAGKHIQTLSRAQFEYAKSLMQSGASAGEAVAKTKQYGDVINAARLTTTIVTRIVTPM